MKESFAYCADQLRETDRDRYLATLFAPAEKREALFALYAFDSEIARVRDLARELMPGEIRLQWWREVLSGERAGEAAANPIAAAVAEILDRFDFVREPLVHLIETHRFDVHNQPIESLEALQSYAKRTGGTIFDLAVRLLGGRIESTVAHESGIACGTCRTSVTRSSKSCTRRCGQDSRDRKAGLFAVGAIAAMAHRHGKTRSRSIPPARCIPLAAAMAHLARR